MLTERRADATRNTEHKVTNRTQGEPACEPASRACRDLSRVRPSRMYDMLNHISTTKSKSHMSCSVSQRKSQVRLTGQPAHAGTPFGVATRTHAHHKGK
jgi:hypothetical protein